jgi:hypothetical protein
MFVSLITLFCSYYQEAHQRERCQLVVLHLNPVLTKYKLVNGGALTQSQCESTLLHVRKALLAAEDTIGGGDQLHLNVENQTESSHIPPPVSSTSTFDDFMCSFQPEEVMIDEELEVGSDAAARELVDYGKLSTTDKSLEVVVGKDKKKKFVPQKFWAHPAITARFPLHASLARSYFFAILHEATSERSFSDCGRQLGDKRRNMDKQIVCAQVRLVTGERIEALPTETVMPVYESRKRKSSALGDGRANLGDDDDENQQFLALTPCSSRNYR